MLSVAKLKKRGTTPIIGKKCFGRIQMYGGGMGNNTPLRGAQLFKLSLKPIIAPLRMRRVLERGVKYE